MGKLDCNYKAKPTNLVCGETYYVAKGTSPDVSLFATYLQATKVFADTAAVIAGTGVIAAEAGATAGDIYTFTEVEESCMQQSLITSNVVSRSANTDIYNGQQYQLWDASKIQGCKCDLGYDGPDCSHRISPHGDDPLTTVKSNMMKQAVKIYGKSSATFIREQFLMVYHDPYGGIWRTDAIDGTTNDNIAASRVQDALRALPNEVLEGVKVTGTASTPSICHRFDDGVRHLSAFEDFHIGHHKDAKYASNFCEHSHWPSPSSRPRSEHSASSERLPRFSLKFISATEYAAFAPVIPAETGKEPGPLVLISTSIKYCTPV